MAALFGVLALLAIPAAVFGSRLVSGVRLLESLYISVPVSCLLGLSAVAATRRARFDAARSVRPDGARPKRLIRLVAFLGLYMGVTGALALAVYGTLRWAQ
ncbi:MAG TPA: hypothetical protein VNC40_13735 [Gaiellaceae bacterium]|nr:hypothetical protein [Gaiellaceae bacterium]